MPELPEVEITVRGLNKKVLERTFVDVWTDFEKVIKKPKDFEEFKKGLKGKEIQKVWRRGKNIIFDLSDNLNLLIHQKLTGHLLTGNWKMKNGNWKPSKNKFLQERVNNYIHLMFWLDKGLMLALSDLRKFAKVELWDSKKLRESKEIKSLGLEPLAKDFSFEKFKKAFSKRRKGKIKSVLMDQTIIAGIGNIYSDEILWKARIHPLKDVSKLKDKDLRKIYHEIKKILTRAIKFHGSSVSNFRDTEGRKGKFDQLLNVYRKEGKKCPRCGTIIRKIKIAGRTAHFCSNCQKF